MVDSISQEIKEYITKIEDLHKEKKFNNYIEYMVFPFYKNLEKDSRIDLDFPITVLVGKNGSGKSSTLHAFYGAVKGRSIGYFWFSTDLDPIKESVERNRFYYGYRENKNSETKEVRKSRIKRSESVVKTANPENWETTRPAVTEGMKKLPDGVERNEPVEKEVIYIDFRRELSAFDKFFYFSKPPKEGTKQDFLRKRAKYLKNLFDKNNPLYYRPKKEVVSKDVVELDKKEVEEINQILNKRFTNIKMVDHRLFDFWGTSIFVKTEATGYSEANAGSGEIAIIKLVYKIINAKPFSLILLDEPEVSLHPSAQRKLKLFLLKEVYKKKHQIIISSHSNELISNMPQGSLKLFQTTISGKFEINNKVKPLEAFYSIEEYVIDKINLICEDDAAKTMLEFVAEKLEIGQFFDIKYYPGGAETIFTKYIPVYCRDENSYKNSYIFFDGDKYKGVALNPANITFGTTSQELERYVVSMAGSKISPLVDGYHGEGREDQKLDFYKNYIAYLYHNVSYFPVDTIPEFILLKSIEGRRHAEELGIDMDTIPKDDCKEIIKLISQKLFRGDTSELCNITLRYLTQQWVQEENEDDYYKQIKNNILEIYSAFNGK